MIHGGPDLSAALTSLSMHAGAMALGICTFNRGEAFTHTLEALARLDRAGGRLARLIIINNASTDATADIARQFAREHPSLNLEVLNEPRPGKVHAMHRLFAHTTEPWVGIIDDDTLPEPDWARALLHAADELPRAGVLGGQVLNVWESGPTPLARIYRRSLGDFDLGPRRIRLDKPDSFLLGASLLCRRSAVEISGWLEGSLLLARTGTDLQCGAEDAELCIRVRKAGGEIWFEPRARMGHLIPARRQTPEYLARLREDVERSMPGIAWVAGLVPTAEFAEAQAAKARVRYRKTLLLDWRPRRRRVRLAERKGRLAGWLALADRLRAK